MKGKHCDGEEKQAEVFFPLLTKLIMEGTAEGGDMRKTKMAEMGTCREGDNRRKRKR